MAFPPPNFIIYVPDDLGREQVRQFGLDTGGNEARQPHLDALMQRGVRFTRAYSQPFCSPTRACLLTGRFAFRTGIGQLVGGNTQPLLDSEVCLPQALTLGTDGGYASGAFGKWHLSNFSNQDRRHPIHAGFDYFAGTMGNISGLFDYFTWPYTIAEKTRSGRVQIRERIIHEYAVTKTVDDALAWITKQDATDSRPWLAYVCVNSPHEPIHRPPAGTYDAQKYVLPHEEPDIAGGEDSGPYFKAMIQNVDYNLGRLLAGIPQRALANTYVIWFTDNGTEANQLGAAGLNPAHAKRTVYEQGIGVPMVVSGPRVARGGSSSSALVCAVDLPATVCDLAGFDLASLVSPTPVDGVSFSSVLFDSTTLGLRGNGFSDIFIPNRPYSLSLPGGLPNGSRAVWGRIYKLIWRINAGNPPLPTEEFYNVALDPTETNNLLLPADVGPGPLTGADLTGYNNLNAFRNALLA